MKKKIAIVIPRLSDSAPCKIAMQLADGLSSYENYQVDLYYLMNNKESTKIHYSYSNIKPKKIKVRLLKEIFQHEIINSHCIQSDFFVAVFRFLNKFKWISTLHCDPKMHFSDHRYKLFSKLISMLWIRALRNSEKVILLNDHIKYSLKELNNTEVMPNGLNVCFDGVSPDISADIKKFARDRLIVGSYGALRELKGFDQLVAVAPLLPSNYCIVIAGSGPLHDQFKNKISNDKLNDKILLLGHVPDAHNLLNLFDCFVLPSRSEGFPLAIIEAYSSGIRLIKSNIPQFLEIQDESLVYGLNDIAELKKAIIASQARPKVSSYNLKLFKENYSLNSLSCRYDNVFRGLN